MEKCGNLWKNGRFSGRIWPDWGNTAQADMAGLGSIGLNGPYLLLCILNCLLRHMKMGEVITVTTEISKVRIEPTISWQIGFCIMANMPL